MVYLDLLLVGFGHVGQRFARLLQEKSVALRRDYGLSWRVVGIATRTPRIGLRRPRPRHGEGAQAGRRRRDARRPDRRRERPHAPAGRLGPRPHPPRHRRVEASPPAAPRHGRDDAARHRARAAGDRPRDGGPARRGARRHRQQGAGGLRVPRAAGRSPSRRTASSCSRAPSWTACPSSTSCARRCRSPTSRGSAAWSTPRPTTC